MATPTVNLVASSSLTPSSHSLLVVATAAPGLPAHKTSIHAVSQSLTKFEMVSMLYPGPVDLVIPKHRLASGTAPKLFVSEFIGRGSRKRPLKGQLWPRTR